MSLVSALVILFCYRYLTGSRPEPGPIPETGSIVVVSDVSDDPVKVYRNQIVPLLDDFDRRNEEYVGRAIATLHDRISIHRSAIKPFSEELMSWGTRFGVVGRSASDLWDRWWHDNKNADSVKEYVNGKFQNWILSEGKLKDDVNVVIQQFNNDMAASRNRLYAELALPLRSIKAPVTANDPNLEQFQRAVQQRAEELTKPLALDSVVGGLAGFAGGWIAFDVAEAITQRVITAILTRFASSMTIEAVEAGGAMLGGAAAGGGAGSLGGPVGTVIGLGVGLAGGAVVDWWMSKQFEEKMSEQCTSFLESVERRLADGGDHSPGLRKELMDAVHTADDAQRKAILSVLTKGAI